MMRFAQAFVVSTMIFAPQLAHALGFGVNVRPQYRTEITPLDGGIYEVKAIGSSAPVNYWCGIGDFAIRTLGVPGPTRIYIYRAYEPGVRTVQFSMTPPPGADTTPGYSITVKRVGENMSATSAQSYCFDNFMDFGF